MDSFHSLMLKQTSRFRTDLAVPHMPFVIASASMDGSPTATSSSAVAPGTKFLGRLKATPS